MCCRFGKNQQLLSIIAPIITHLSSCEGALMQHVHGKGNKKRGMFFFIIIIKAKMKIFLFSIQLVMGFSSFHPFDMSNDALFALHCLVVSSPITFEENEKKLLTYNYSQEKIAPVEQSIMRLVPIFKSTGKQS
jgi:hypothetical protein